MLSNAKTRIAVTGATGFIGTHLCSAARVSGRFEPVAVSHELLNDHEKLAYILKGCSAVVHLAGISRSEDPENMYSVNMDLVRRLADAMPAENMPHIFFASTTHEAKDSPYHKSKRDGRAFLEDFARNSGASVTTLLMPNAFGPYGRPFYNSAVSTFCRIAAGGGTPERIDRAELKLIHVYELAREIIKFAEADEKGASAVTISHTTEIMLDELWSKLEAWREAEKNGTIPKLLTVFDFQLWDTFQSYKV